MKYELIIFVLIVVGNGAVALWKKWKEQQAAQPARQPSGTRTPPAPPKVRERPDRRSEIERLRERARAKARAFEAASATRAPAPAPVIVPVPPAAARNRPTAAVAPAPFPVRGIDRRNLRQAMLIHEILGPPRSLRPHP